MLLTCTPYLAEVARTTCNVGQTWFRLRKRKMNISVKSAINRSTAIIIWAFCPLTPPPPPLHQKGSHSLLRETWAASYAAGCTGVTLKSMADCVVSAVAYSRKTLISFVISVCSHVWAPLQLDRFDIEHFLRKSVEELQIWLMLANNVGHFAWRHKYFLLLPAT
jgi:hypothetical protein